MQRIGAELGGAPAGFDANDLHARRPNMPRTKGIIIADTKFEFGTVEGELVSGRRSADAGFLAFLAARIPTSPAARRTPTTSSSCAITWSGFAGQVASGACRCLPRLPGGPVKSTRKRIAPLTGREL